MGVEIITHKARERFFIHMEMKGLLKMSGGEHSAVFFCAVCSCSSEQRGVQGQHINHCNRHKPSGAESRSYTRWIDTATVPLTMEGIHISNIFTGHLREKRCKKKYIYIYSMVSTKNWKSFFAKETKIVNPVTHVQSTYLP